MKKIIWVKTDHDENTEGISWLLFVHPTQEVVADDVDQTRAQIVFGLHHHVDAVRTQGGQPASEGLSTETPTLVRDADKDFKYQYIFSQKIAVRANL